MSARNRTTAFALGGIAVAMVGAAYASVPLYQLFCQVTGYGGTTQQTAEVAPDQTIVSDRVITVRFNSDKARDLNWRFKPVQREIAVKVGENALAFYQATNRSDGRLVGTSTYNVTPHKAGIYFNKVDCFCFTEQALAPGQTVDMPVSFFVDPDIVNDPNMKDVHTITLSYTFFKVKDQDGRGEADRAALLGPDGRQDQEILAGAGMSARRDGKS